MSKKGKGFWVLIIVAAVLVIFYLMGQTLSLFNYELAVKMGMQESDDEIGRIGVAFAKGYAFADTIFYIPLLILGIVGLLRGRKWGLYSMVGALAISVYWPASILYSIFVDTGAYNLSAEKYLTFSIILPLVMLYGLWGLWYLYRNN